MKLESKKIAINAPDEKVFTYICDLTNFVALLPDTAIDKKATAETCSFIMKRTMTKLSFFIKEKNPNTEVILASDDTSGFKAQINFHVKALDAGSEFFMDLDVDLNPMFAMMAKGPLQIFIDLIAANLKAAVE